VLPKCGIIVALLLQNDAEVLRMHRIAFLVPHASMVESVQNVLASYGQIHAELCPLNDRISTAKKLVGQGFEIIVARSGVASRIRRSSLNVTVVDLPVTTLDFIRALESARAHGKNIAVVAYAPMVKGIETIAPALRFSFRQYLTESDDDSEI